MSRFRPGSRARGAALAALLLTLAAPVLGQGASPVLVIDQDKLFTETRLGAEALDALEKQAQDLATENQSIETDLLAEELELTEKRPSLTPEEFRALADAFDQRVQRLRAEQDEKARKLNRAREEAQSNVLRASANIISDIVRSRGAVVVLDRRNVFLSADSIDITDEAIEKINAAE